MGETTLQQLSLGAHLVLIHSAEKIHFSDNINTKWWFSSVGHTCIAIAGLFCDNANGSSKL